MTFPDVGRRAQVYEVGTVSLETLRTFVGCEKAV